MFKVNNKYTRTTSRRSGTFFVKFEYISHFFLVCYNDNFEHVFVS